jgi:hypothetical protein
MVVRWSPQVQLREFEDQRDSYSQSSFAAGTDRQILVGQLKRESPICRFAGDLSHFAAFRLPNHCELGTLEHLSRDKSIANLHRHSFTIWTSLSRSPDSSDMTGPIPGA